ncbi:uncharacterized protein LOC105211943 [Zeugodacus cucurbitae]|uniref:uncharacterized protein LOC105211943 n=1 Tax=Zeugodacus cucurbitae TaxID=28588 RepID=UPI0023D933D8|nr:uncharacterized protein LOC105211943 [Zeugodacus cucurbitae]
MHFYLLCLYGIAFKYAVIITAVEASNYEFILDQLIAVKEDDDVGKINVEFIQSEDGVKISGIAEQLVALDNAWKIKILLKRAEDAEKDYNTLMPLPAMRVCDFMLFFYRMYIYESLVKYSNAPSPYVCPVVKNTYVIKEYPIVSDKFKQYLHPGYYQVEVSLWHKDVEKLNYIIEGHVEEE